MYITNMYTYMTKLFIFWYILDNFTYCTKYNTAQKFC